MRRAVFLHHKAMLLDAFHLAFWFRRLVKAAFLVIGLKCHSHFDAKRIPPSGWL
jgi:hypothetical protein